MFDQMNGQEFKAARERLGFTQREMAEALGMGKYGCHVISRWESQYLQFIPGTVDIATRYMLKYGPLTEADADVRNF